MNPTTPPIPSFVDDFITALAQKGLTAVASLLTGYGVFTSSAQSVNFVMLGLAVVAWVVSFAWTWVNSKFHAKTFALALNAAPAGKVIVPAAAVAPVPAAPPAPANV